MSVCVAFLYIVRSSLLLQLIPNSLEKEVLIFFNFFGKLDVGFSVCLGGRENRQFHLICEISTVQFSLIMKKSSQKNLLARGIRGTQRLFSLKCF